MEYLEDSIVRQFIKEKFCSYFSKKNLVNNFLKDFSNNNIMKEEKGVGKINSDFEQKKDKVVELPILDFFINNFSDFICFL